MPGKPVDEYMTVPQAAEAARCSGSWLRKLLAEGKLAGVQVGGVWLVEKAAVKALDLGPLSLGKRTAWAKPKKRRGR